MVMCRHVAGMKDTMENSRESYSQRFYKLKSAFSSLLSDFCLQVAPPTAPFELNNVFVVAETHLEAIHADFEAAQFSSLVTNTPLLPARADVVLSHVRDIIAVTRPQSVRFLELLISHA
jgi:hypothetical protein